MLDTQGPLIEAWIRETGDIADHRDAVDGVTVAQGTQRTVGEHTVGEIKAITVKPRDIAGRPDGFDDDIGPQDRAIGQFHLADHFVSEESIDRSAEAEPDPVLFEPTLQFGGQHLPERTDHRQRIQRDARHLAAALAGSGGHFAANESGPEYQHVRTLAQERAQGDGITESANNVAPGVGVRCVAVDSEPSGRHAGGDD